MPSSACIRCESSPSIVISALVLILATTHPIASASRAKGLFRVPTMTEPVFDALKARGPVPAPFCLVLVAVLAARICQLFRANVQLVLQALFVAITTVGARGWLRAALLLLGIFLKTRQTPRPWHESVGKLLVCGGKVRSSANGS